MRGKDDSTNRHNEAGLDGSPVDSSGIDMSEASDAAGEGVSRREMLKITAGAVMAVPLVASELKAKPANADLTPDGKTPLFFTTDEFAMVDELTELIIPTDEHSPGARSAGCAGFIDSQLAEAWDPKTKDQWREGLNLVNQLSQEMNGKPFMQATTEQRVAVLTRMASNERKPAKPEERFFGELKSRTAHAYYTSKVGIHQEMEYKGNTYQKEFSGFDAT